jgi:branched-subunit amino acid aminotransferase/4-amino-4-deoxychorismate lyase
VDAGGTVLEATTSNVWWRADGKLYTPAVNTGILDGVTRGVLAVLAPAVGYDVREGSFALDELASADEAFTSSSVREVMPVVELDGRQIGEGRPGTAAAELQVALREQACR